MKLAGCIITDDSERILLIHKNSSGRNQWEVPGGKLEEGESSKQAACREISEEIGVDVELIRELGHCAFHQDDTDLEYTWFLARITRGEPSIMEPDKFDDLQYFRIDEMSKIRLSTGAWNFLGMLADEELKL